MVKGFFCFVIEFQLREAKLRRQWAFQNTSGERRVCSFEHAIQVHGCFSLHGIFHLVQLPPQALHHLIITMRQLLSMFKSIHAPTILGAVSFIVVSAVVVSLERSVASFKTCTTLQVLILFH